MYPSYSTKRATIAKSRRSETDPWTGCSVLYLTLWITKLCTLCCYLILGCQLSHVQGSSQVENRSDAIRHKYPLSFSIWDQFHGCMCDGVRSTCRSWTVKYETSLTPIRTSSTLVSTDNERQDFFFLWSFRLPHFEHLLKRHTKILSFLAVR